VTRMLHTSDWHVGRRIRGVSRQAEQEAVLDEIVGVAEEREVDLVLVAGDQFDVSSPPPWAEHLVYSTLVRLGRIAPTLVVAGNHDHASRLAAVAPLLELAGVRVGAHVSRAEEGGAVDLGDLGVHVSLLPWQSQRGIVSADDLMSKDAADHSQSYADRMRRIVAALVESRPTDRLGVVLGHLTAHGAASSGSERDVHTVVDYSVPSSVFSSDLSYVALGHFHRSQKVPAGPPVWYSGSPLQLDFGEVGEDKQVLVVDAEPGVPAKVTPVPLSSGRRLVRLRGTLGDVEAAAATLPEDALVRVEIDETQRAGLADEVRELVPGAVEVVLAGPTRADGTAPSQARLGRPRQEVFAEYLSEQGIEDERIVRLFSTLVEEAS
jgi:exonuclease SbcD